MRTKSIFNAAAAALIAGLGSASAHEQIAPTDGTDAQALNAFDIAIESVDTIDSGSAPKVMSDFEMSQVVGAGPATEALIFSVVESINIARDKEIGPHSAPLTAAATLVGLNPSP